MISLTSLISPISQSSLIPLTFPLLLAGSLFVVLLMARRKFDVLKHLEKELEYYQTHSLHCPSDNEVKALEKYLSVMKFPKSHSYPNGMVAAARHLSKILSECGRSVFVLCTFTLSQSRLRNMEIKQELARLRGWTKTTVFPTNFLAITARFSQHFIGMLCKDSSLAYTKIRAGLINETPPSVVLPKEFAFPVSLSEILGFMSQEEQKDQLKIELNCTFDGSVLPRIRFKTELNSTSITCVDVELTVTGATELVTYVNKVRG